MVKYIKKYSKCNNMQEAVTILNVTRYAMRDKRLIPWVKFIWHLEAINADFHYKLLPTDCIDVILNLADDMIYETEFSKIVAPPFHVNGLRSKYSFIHQEGNICIYGISFYPFGLYPFIHKSCHELQDDILNLHRISNSLAQKLKRTVTNDDTNKIIAAIKNTLIEELSINQSFTEKAQLISDFLSLDDRVNIKSFCNGREINIKTFERMFLSYTGYTPKFLRCIRRFQNASNQLTHQHFASLTDITYDNSFNDQSHFTKEFTRFSGSVPRIFQSEKASVKENVIYTYH